MVDGANRWSYISGIHSIGRFAVASTRQINDTLEDGENNPPINGQLTGGKIKRNTKAPDSTPSAADGSDSDGHDKNVALQIEADETNAQVGEVGDTGNLGVEMDLMIGQMTLRSKHLQALEVAIANHPDVKLIFGDSTMQASI